MPALTVGQLLVNEILPPELRDYNRVMDSGALDSALAEVARSHPDQYRDISARLMRLGNRASVDSGVTLRLSDTLPTFDRSVVYRMVDEQEDAIRNDKELSDKEKKSLIDKLYSEATDLMFGSAYDSALKRNNPFAIQVKSKARGNKAQLGALMASPGVYTDTKGNPVPMFIRHSYADGLTPAEMWAGSYGARNGVVAGKQATRKGGEMGKLLASLAIDQVVTEEDCGSPYGMPVLATDKDNIGSVLAYDAGGHKAGEVITKSTIQDFIRDGVENIAVRSPVTCQASRGICSHCAGIRETGKFPEIGYNLGVNAASAISEKIAQAGLNCLVEGTLVRMADSSVRPIEKVKAGEYVMGSDMFGRVSPTRVVAVYDNGVQPCVRTRFIENGTHKGSNPGILLESTAIHKILGTRVVTGQDDERLNWVPRMLPVGQRSRRFFGYTVTSFDDTGLIEEPMAMLVGALLGDGCYTKSVNGVHLSCADDTEIEDLEKTVSGCGLRFKRLKYHNGIYYRVSNSRSRSHRNVAKDYLVKNGMYGKFAHEKELPDVVRTWNNHSVGCLIGGLIATDGSVYASDSNGKPGVSFASTSRRLVEQVKELVGLRFGILGSAICKTGRAGNEFRKHDQWQFTVTKPDEVVKLFENVTIPGVKRHRLAKMVRDYGEPGVCRIAFRRVSQEEIGDRHVYDLEVECKDHIFLLANGLVVSNTKHSGRLTSGAGQYQGFDLIKALTRVPQNFPYKAAVSPKDGSVEQIKEAPQGGTYITVGGEKVYVAPGYDLKVKVGDSDEAGDQLADGVIDPKDVVNYKGIGEGRRYFTERFTKALRDSGYAAHRRNIESVARALVDHVEIEDEDAEGKLLPGDVTSYSNWARGYSPRPDTVRGPARSLVGKYLEQPALHYTIGTKITKRVADDLDRFGLGDDVYANANPINVRPVMQSIVKSTGTDRDWMSRLGTTYLKSRLLEDAQHGSTADVHGTNPLPGLAKGTEFGNYFDPGVRRPGGYTY